MSDKKKLRLSPLSMKRFSFNWSVDKLLKELNELGVEFSLDISRTNNSVSFNIRHRKLPRDRETITKLLFSLYGEIK